MEIEGIDSEREQLDTMRMRNDEYDIWGIVRAKEWIEGHRLMKHAEARNDEFGRMEYEEWQELSAALGLKYENRSGAWLMNKNRENAGRGM